MKVENFDYHFKLRNSKDVALNLGVIYKDLGYSKIDKNKLSKLYNITSQDVDDKNYIDKFGDAVEKFDLINQNKINDLCEQLNNKWQIYKKGYLDVIKETLDIEVDLSVTNHTYCYLHSLPINEIYLNDNTIYLDYNKTFDEVFNKFIVMLTKILLINRWNSVNNWSYNKEFDTTNKVLMFAEIAIDAIFYNSKLFDISNNASYKYFYSLKVKGVNVMEHFRNIYTTKKLDNFFTDIYMFVHENYSSLLQFKNYLY